MKKICTIVLIIMTCTLTNALAKGILPTADELLGTTVPNPIFALGREADAKIQKDDGSTDYIFENCTELEYELLDRYLTAVGCHLGICEQDGKQIIVSIIVNGVKLSIQYETSLKTLTINYPKGVRFEKTTGEFSDTGDLLPSLEELLVNLPNLQTILNSCPSETHNENGSLVEIYTEFSDSDYNLVSIWLQNNGCILSDYSVLDNTIHARLESNRVEFEFEYDREHAIARISYPEGTRPEPAPEPTPVLTPKPIATNRPILKSVKECWRIAEDYFYGIGWKNPYSVIIYNHNYLESDAEVAFFIDYSAQNGFGGYNRSMYGIVVDRITGKVTSAYNFDY